MEKLRKRRTRRPFTFGKLVHSMLENHANGDDPFEVLEKIPAKDLKMFRVEREIFGDIVGDIRTIMTEYFDYWDEKDLVALRKNKRSAEHEFNIEVEKGLIITGKIDEVNKSKNGLKWLTDHKTFTRLPNEDHRWRNLQSSVYIRAIEMLGWWDNIAGTCWNYIGSKPPTKPQLLKSGDMSERKIDTLPSVVHSALKENKLRAKDYPKLIQMAEENRRHYFQRIMTPVSKGVVDFLFNQFVGTAREIAEFHGLRSDMNVDRHCEYCEYEGICRARLTGSDVDFVKEREYYIDENEKQNEVEVEGIE